MIFDNLFESKIDGFMQQVHTNQCKCIVAYILVLFITLKAKSIRYLTYNNLMKNEIILLKI